MKEMFKKYLYTALAALTLTSCGEDLMDRINKDEHNPSSSSVDAKFQVTDAVVSTAYSTWSGDYAFYAALFNEQAFGTGNNQFMKAEMRQRSETAASTTFNNCWNSTYGNLINIKQMIEKCEEGRVNAGQKDVLGIGQVLWVLCYEALTDLHGDIPYSEALVSPTAKLDKQEDIYKDLFTRIDEAIAALDEAAKAKVNNVGNQDLLFSGDPAKWLGLAHAVKARLLLNTTFRDQSAFAKVIAEGEAALSLGFSGAELGIFNGVDCDNSWTAFQWSRYYVGASKTFADILAERNDPRLDVYAVDYFETGVTCAPAGDESLAKMTETVGFPLWLDNGAATLHIYSLSELYFNIAEAKARLGQDASAELLEGVKASFADYEAATGETLTAGADEYVAALGAVSLKEVMVQKYIAMARDGHVQTYNDLRRCKAMGEEFIKLLNPNNENGGQNMWPLRLAYGNSDVVSNPNVAAAFGSGNEAGNYLFTENVWLFGGSR